MTTDPADKDTPRTARTGRPSRALLVAFGLLVFLVLVVALAPAGVVGRIVDASTPRARLLEPAGSLWQGSADLYVDGTGFGRLHWQVRPLALLRGRLAADLELAAPGHEVRGRAELALLPWGLVTLDGVQADIEPATLDAVLAPYDIRPSGRIEVRDAGARWRGRQLQDAAGDAHWSGGAVRYRLAGQNWYATMPPLDARLDASGGVPVLAIRDPQGQPVLDVRLEKAGWAHLRIRYRLAQLAGFPWADPPDPDTIVLELSEQVL